MVSETMESGGFMVKEVFPVCVIQELWMTAESTVPS